MLTWFRNAGQTVGSISAIQYIALRYFARTYRRGTCTACFAYSELPVPVKSQESKRVCLPVWTKAGASA
jgi:hypothetical protein